jgi:diaminopimelate epimerase
MKVEFTKLQGAGNDFVLVDAREMNRDWAALAARICDRHFGVGADGLLLVLPSGVADLRLRVFNADGSEAEACGNGLRCFVRYARDRGLVRADEFSVETMAGTRTVRVRDGRRIQVAMGRPELNPSAIPVALEGLGEPDAGPVLAHPIEVDGTRLSIGCVSMGNPHAVCFLSAPVADFPMAEIGPRVERHRAFPNRVNFEVANVISRGEIRARVWERGTGETFACGSGACAITVIAILKGLSDSAVDVHLPGGVLSIEWDGAGDVLLSGPAEAVFSGTWAVEKT